MKSAKEALNDAQRVAASVDDEPELVQAFEPRSASTCQKRAIQIARKWNQVPDDVTDVQAIERGLITPDQIILIITLFQELLGCLSNRPAMAMNRIRAYKDGKELDRVADTVRFNWMIDRWMSRLGYPRERGDVNFLRYAFLNEAEGITEADVAQIETELMWVTI